MKKIFVFLVSLFLSFGFADGYGNIKWEPLEIGKLNLIAGSNYYLNNEKQAGIFAGFKKGPVPFSVFCWHKKDSPYVMPVFVVNYYDVSDTEKIKDFFKQKKTKYTCYTDIEITADRMDLLNKKTVEAFEELYDLNFELGIYSEKGKTKVTVYEYNEDTDAHVFEFEKGTVVVFSYRPPEV